MPTSPLGSLRFISRPEKAREEAMRNYEGHRRTVRESIALLGLEEAEDRLRLLSECRLALMGMGVELYELEKAEREIARLRAVMERGWLK